MSGNGGENVSGADGTGGMSGSNFASRMHEAAVADRSQQKRQGEIESENTRAQIALGKGDCMTWAQSYVFEYATVFAQRDFAFGAAVQVVEDSPGQSASRQRSEVCDTDDAGSSDGA